MSVLPLSDRRVGCSRRRAWGALFEDSQDILFLHDEILGPVDLHLAAGVLAEEDTVALLDGEREPLALVGHLAGADRDDLALLGLILGGVGDDDAAVLLVLLLDAPDEDAVMKRVKGSSAWLPWPLGDLPSGGILP
jgi:hypothetical protein